MVWVGRLSYAIYLWHVPMRAWIGDAWPGFELASAAVLAAVLTLACAALTYYAIEMPIRNWAARRINGRSTARAAEVPVRSDVVASLDAPSAVTVSA